MNNPGAAAPDAVDPDAAPLPNHNPIFHLTAEEKRQAMDLKEAVEAADHIENLSDFDYVTMTLGCDGDIPRAVDATYKLQSFRKLYNIQETPQDGVAALRGLMLSQPETILEICYLPTEHTYWFFVDFSKFRPALVQSYDDWRHFQAGAYYIYRAMASNLQSIKTGAITMIECDGVTTDNVSLEFEERIFIELFSYYPVRYKETFCLHSPMAFVVFLGVIKRFMSNRMLRSIQTAATFNGYDGRVDQLFKMPTVEIAQERLLSRMETYLTERYQNERDFSLND
ncbi:expressed unknown protein [Seminavis robusta]|uniref:CRAL-TRIO domain-containing protein n=1 Tax=Seminavis robusta TaxID=568900 RepID=A0A9N8HJ17_9STRA|nr:expressed unknown protein [Seminavis robusta]|eukprot:Sro628_g178080.1 n/a (283) ;mRNA; f:32615-33463